MPTISRFYGIIVSIHTEVGGKHHTPHVHATSGDKQAVYDFNGNTLGGSSLPSREHKLMVAWIELHKAELEKAWEMCQNGIVPSKIAPLK